MKIKVKLPQIKPKITANKIIKVLTSLTLCLWIIAYLYLMSNKAFGPIFNYDTAFLDKKSVLEEQIGKNRYAGSADLKSAYEEFCQISLCENDFASAESYIKKLINLPIDEKVSKTQVNLYLFIANVYRDFDKIEQAQTKYYQSLSDLSTFPSVLSLNECSVTKAKILNNIGTTYFLAAKVILDKKECRKQYSLSNEYFKKALDALGASDPNLNRTIQTNLEQCSSELKFLD